VGTGVCLVVQRDPIHTAKEVATLDRLSGGRFLLLMRERIAAMKAIWTEDEPEHHGRHVDFGPMWQEPKPLQKPHPPILVGGLGSKVLDRVIAFGDEWMPNRIGEEDRFLERVGRLRRRAREEAGREVAVTLLRAPADPAQLERLEAAGVHRVATWLPPGEPGEVERALDAWVETAAA
jgi:alkanesulfonate monooxygenase SsuD/methylene tetrahydromethanopterin reductase-like flavin-dependent oxidoreductase (luciferase family)